MGPSLCRCLGVFPVGRFYFFFFLNLLTSFLREPLIFKIGKLLGECSLLARWGDEALLGKDWPLRSSLWLRIKAV